MKHSSPLGLGHLIQVVRHSGASLWLQTIAPVVSGLSVNRRIAGVQFIMVSGSRLHTKQVVELTNPSYIQADVLIGLDEFGLFTLGL